MKSPRDHAKEQQAYFVKFEVTGKYLPKSMQPHHGGSLKSEGPVSSKRGKDVLAVVMFLMSDRPLYECLVEAGKLYKENGW